MPRSDVRRVRVWGAGVRWAHWLTALSALTLLGTGYVLASFPYHSAAQDYHMLSGWVLAGALGLRGYLLLFGEREANVRAWLPARDFGRSLAEMMKFYVTLGRAPMTRWYAHNPAWAPIYLLLFLMLGFQVLTGFGLAHQWFETEKVVFWHGAGADVVLVVTLAHLVAVFLHDLCGTGSDTSGMINGHRTFVIPEVSADSDPLRAVTAKQTDGSRRSR